MLTTTERDIRFFTYFASNWESDQLHNLFTYTNVLFKLNADFGAMWYYRLRYADVHIERQLNGDQLEQLLGTPLVRTQMSVKVPYTDLPAAEQSDIVQHLARHAFKDPNFGWYAIAPPRWLVLDHECDPNANSNGDLAVPIARKVEQLEVPPIWPDVESFCHFVLTSEERQRAAREIKLANMRGGSDQAATEA